MKIGFIGTGSMGKPMARHLLENDHTVFVYNRTPQQARPLDDEGAKLVDTPPEVAGESDIVVTMVSDDDAVTDVVFGSGEQKGFIESLQSDSIHLCMSTISPDTSRVLDKAHDDRNQNYVASPVFGKPNFAREGTLSVVAAGPDGILDRCVPVYEAVGRQWFNVGPHPFQANTVKLAGNFTIAAMMETLGESFALMENADIDPRLFLDVINRSLFDSPLYEAYGTTIAERDFEPAGFKLELGLKDMRLAQETARENDTPMPLLSLVHDNLLSAVAEGKGEIDWAGLGEVAARRAGLDEE